MTVSCWYKISAVESRGFELSMELLDNDDEVKKGKGIKGKHNIPVSSSFINHM